MKNEPEIKRLLSSGTGSCPLPLSTEDSVRMGHGSGGRMTQRLIEKMFLPAFANAELNRRHDGAVFPAGDQRLAFTTDSFVVRPLFFSGGDIGSLAVHGTVNDLAMCGARPLYLSAAFILEEGVSFEVIEKIVASMRHASRESGISLVTGDTKVVDRGKGDGVYITTTGVGRVEFPGLIGPAQVQSGDALLVSGDIGRHGMAVMTCREGLSFENPIESDSAPLHIPVLDLLSKGVSVRCLRDLTRGGLATALVEIAEAAGMEMELNEKAVPVCDNVRGACELLGLDPLYVANEGRFAVWVPAAQAEEALSILRKHPVSAGAVAAGRVTGKGSAGVTLLSRIGTRRLLDMLTGDALPRIC